MLHISNHFMACELSILYGSFISLRSFYVVWPIKYSILYILCRIVLSFDKKEQQNDANFNQTKIVQATALFPCI